MTETSQFGGVSVPTKYQPMILASAARWNVSPAILAAQLQAESDFNENSVSSAGAVGIAQFLPSTAKSIGVNPYNAQQAIDGMARLDSEYRDKFGSIELALAAYNAGPGAVSKYDGIPPYAETQNYVKKILGIAGDSIDANPASITDAPKNIFKLFQAITSGRFWTRIGIGSLGVLIVILSATFLLENSNAYTNLRRQAVGFFTSKAKISKASDAEKAMQEM